MTRHVNTKLPVPSDTGGIQNLLLTSFDRACARTSEQEIFARSIRSPTTLAYESCVLEGNSLTCWSTEALNMVIDAKHGAPY